MQSLKGTQEYKTVAGQDVRLDYYVIKDASYGFQIVKSVRQGDEYVRMECETEEGVTDNEFAINAIIENLIVNKVTPAAKEV